MPEYNESSPDLVQEIAELRRRLEALEKGNPFENATIGSGGITVEGGDIVIESGGSLRAEYANGVVGLEFGPIRDPSWSPIYDQGLVLYNTLGLLAIAIAKQQSSNNFDVSTSTNAIQNLDLYASSIFIEALGGAGLALGGDVLTNIFGAEILLNAPGGDVRIPNFQTTGSAANVFMTAAGIIQRVTSSLRYKTNVEDAEIDPKDVLKLRPRTWQDKDEYQVMDDEAPRYVGFIAEELDAAGLGLFVEYDLQGRPDAIQYDRLVAALIEVVKDQEKRIKTLEALVPPGKSK